MRVTFAASAAKHGVREGRVRYVIRHCRSPLYAPDEDRDDRDLVVYLGPDANGVPLEIVAIETDGGALHVIHAMPMRRKYAEVYAWVMMQR